MSYSYETQKPFVFTESGQVTFLKIRDNAKRLLILSGAVRCDKIMLGVGGDSWNQLACVDRLVELGELYECPNTLSSFAQDRLFISGKDRVY